MPRRARVVIPGVAHHVIQRGHNRQVFATDEDFRCYLGIRITLKKDFGVELCAYCLTTNQVHLLLVPPAVSSLATVLRPRSR